MADRRHWATNAHVSATVRALMRRDDMRQAELAIRLGLDRASLTRALRGGPETGHRRCWQLHEVVALARLFEVSTDELLGVGHSPPADDGGVRPLG